MTTEALDGASAHSRHRPIAAVAVVVGLIAGAFAVRIAVLVSLGSPLIDMDGANFARIAENLAYGYGFVGIRGTLNAVHSSLYPVLAAVPVWFGMPAERAELVISLIAGATLVGPVYGIAGRLAGHRAAVVAGAIVALDIVAISVSAMQVADALALTLAFAGLYAFFRCGEEVKWAFAAGAMFGLAYITRADTMAFALVTLTSIVVLGALRRIPAREAAVRAAAVAAAFAIFAVPYVVTISRATGHARIETKSAVNAAIGRRILAGMSYAEAADGLGPGLREDGAELGQGFFIKDYGIADPSLRERLGLALRGLRSQSARLVRELSSFSFGTPLLAAFAIGGLVRGIRRREARDAYAIVAAIAAAEVASLLTLQHLWTRYTVVFVPLFAVLAAEPLAALIGSAADRLTPRQRRAAVALALVALSGYLVVATARLRAFSEDATLTQRAAAYLADHAPGPKLIMSVGNQIAYYAHGDWMPLPYAGPRETLAYLRLKRPAYIVLEGGLAGSRPYLAAWMRSGIPDPDARLVTRIESGKTSDAIYAWTAPSASSAPERDARGVVHTRYSRGDPVVRASQVTWLAPPGSLPAATSNDSVDVLTAHNDNQRLGWNDRERSLTIAGLTSGNFGKLYELRIDGQSYGQPLIVTGIDVPGLGRRTLLIVATEHDTVYAFDADSGATLWTHTFAGCCGVTAAPARMLSEEPCDSVKPIVGVSSVPVVDRRTETLYVVAKTMTRRGEGVAFHNTLHALALATGADRLPPAEITATAAISTRGMFRRDRNFKHSLARLIPGRGLATFDARAQYNRPGLLLSNGMVYIGFGSHCDIPQSHGWMFVYRASDLARVGAFATTRDWNDENLGSVWQSGFGITADRGGDVYFTTGNGPFNAAMNGRNFSDSLIRMTPALDRIVDYFTPYTQKELSENDADFGGGAMIALPDKPGSDRRLGVASSKIRALFLLDRDQLGRYTEGGPDRVLQTIGDAHDRTHWCIGTCGGPAYYEGPKGEFVFNVWALDSLRAYRVERRGDHPRLVDVAHSPNVFPGSGGSIPSVSSNGRLPGTGIVWSLTRPNIVDVAKKPIELFAFDASNVGKVLYRGPVSLWPNRVGHPFLTPTIANGRVYIAGYRSVTVFGLRSHRPNAPPRS